ncbi:TQO small subunit DoxD [Maricaulis sp.]|uniref:DoxX family protein n=1 Tax=Maricaulis sp. TaxID=1486257 RepID=UPI00261FA858|nr:TQO small subunit DoxD [Maricaulis sp.]
MTQASITRGGDRFMPDWVLGLVIRLSVVPGLWMWGRANAAEWPGVSPDIVSAADYWGIPLIPAPLLAQIAVWGAHIVALMLAVGFLTRLVGFVLLAFSLAYLLWIVPDSWVSVSVFAAVSFYLFARGSGALSVDGALAATTR